MAEGDTIESQPELPDKPSIAVLAFENMSGDPEQEYFSDGITEDIITELSKISGLFVIARHSSFIYKKKQVTVKQVGGELGVRYVLEGSVRRAGNRLRITAQLIDSQSDHHLWVERYDRDLEDVFSVQDEVARKVADALEIALTPGENRRLAKPPTSNMHAYDLYMRARETPFPPTRHNIRSARSAYELVIQLDPTFAGGFAGKSMTHSMAVLFSQSDKVEEDKATALDMAQQAVDLDPDFPRAHSALGLAYSALSRDSESIAAARRAVELQPGDADNHTYLSYCLREAGHFDEACAEVRESLRLDPLFIGGGNFNLLARNQFLAGRYQDAVDAYTRNAERGGPCYIGSMLTWAAACALAGHIEKARELVDDILRERPDLNLKMIGTLRPGTKGPELERLCEGLKLAGVAE